MAKKSRLEFTEEERATPKLEKAISKSEKMADKVDKAKTKIPKKKIYYKERTFDEATGKAKVRLYFEEVDKVKPPSKLSHVAMNTPKKTVLSNVHRKLNEVEDDNVGLKSVHSMERAGEVSSEMIKATQQSIKANPYKKLAKAENKSIKADVNYLYKKSLQDNPTGKSNPISKWQQKRAIKKQYLAKRYMKSTKSASDTISGTTSAIKKGTEAISKAVVSIVKNPKVFLIICALLLMFAIISSLLSSCSLIFIGSSSTTSGTTYTSEDEDLIAVDNQYTLLESSIQAQIDNIETTYSNYDEYVYDLDTIAHDPHELAAYLSALLVVYELGQVDVQLQEILAEQYNLILTDETEIRTRTEIVVTEVLDEYGNIYTEIVETETEYEYIILNVKLENYGIYSVANSLLSSENLEKYYIYRTTLGGKPLLFGGGSSNASVSTDISGVVFIDGERTGNQEIVDIALSQVGNVGGQPYWSWYGFDYRVEWCACYVSWVLNQAGYSEPKFAACTSQGVPYFTSNGRWTNSDYTNIAPGDIIFFDWDNNGNPNHVGIVIGTDGTKVYTIEGNSGDECKIRDYDLNSSYIFGYGLMN